MGASETYGTGAHPQTKGYAYLVARKLKARHFRDTGIPGATLPAAYDTELSSALAVRPSLATVFFGFNDLRSSVTRQEFMRDLHDLVVTLRRAHVRVLIIGLPDLSLLPAVRRQVPSVQLIHLTVVSWNSGMKSIARQTGARFLDLGQFTAELAHHHSYIASDGLHPSNIGHARLAQVVESAIHHDGLWK